MFDFDIIQSAGDINIGASYYDLSQHADEIVDAEVVQESPVMQDYIDGPLTGNTAAKKLMAAAITIAKEKKYISLPEKYDNPQSIGSIADKAVETIKIAHDVATGNLRADRAADYIAKKTAAFAKTAVGRLINRGAAIVGHAVTTAIAAVFPPIEIVRPFIVQGAKFVGQKVKDVVAKGIDKIAETVKPIVRKAVETVKTVATSVWESVKSVGRELLSWIGL
jgi:hypothetical protein